MSFNPSAVRILNNLVTRLNQRQNESGAFDVGDVTKDINMKNESALVLFDTEGDTITLRARRTAAPTRFGSRPTRAPAATRWSSTTPPRA